MHRTTTRFWRCFHALAPETREMARRSYGLLKGNPRHPSLHFKKVGKLCSVRVGRRHRALAVEDEGGLIWVWIGNHAEYERMLEG
uniref:ParE-like toxin domain-containing protein n=1 Tax=Candidatus Kentrum sp. TUN TaxID=2126343 RepID=A0A450ZXZ6_9GAMM|nr:MAG: hypothetical protein BECKTUN1418D_GA0071000_108712 [Candidatus Kentron sp. TUN]